MIKELKSVERNLEKLKVEEVSSLFVNHRRATGLWKGTK